MNHCNGRLILKVKKRRHSIPLPSKHISTDKENQFIEPQKRSLKRLNPFSKSEDEPHEKLKTNQYNAKKDRSEFSLFSGLSEINNKKNVEHNKNETIYEVPEVKDAKEEDELDLEEPLYHAPLYPLNWSIRRRIKFFTSQPLKLNLKPTNDSKAIHNFSRNLESDSHICQYLYNWIHPVIPGVPSYPLHTTNLGNVSKEEKNCINMLANNKELQGLVMKQWRTSFQSLFNMLKLSYCSYFYLCCHQFTVLFKAAGVGSKCMTAILGPTTKGLRDLLTEEGKKGILMLLQKIDFYELNSFLSFILSFVNYNSTRNLYQETKDFIQAF